MVDKRRKSKLSGKRGTGVTVVGEERVDRVSAWAGQDMHMTFNEVET